MIYIDIEHYLTKRPFPRGYKRWTFKSKIPEFCFTHEGSYRDAKREALGAFRRKFNVNSAILEVCP